MAEDESTFRVDNLTIKFSDIESIEPDVQGGVKVEFTNGVKKIISAPESFDFMDWYNDALKQKSVNEAIDGLLEASDSSYYDVGHSVDYPVTIWMWDGKKLSTKTGIDPRHEEEWPLVSISSYGELFGGRYDPKTKQVSVIRVLGTTPLKRSDIPKSLIHALQKEFGSAVSLRVF